MDDIYRKIEEYNPNKKLKILIVFDDVIVDMFSNKKLNPIVTELFISCRKLNISLTVCSCHVTYAFQSESTLYICLNVKELLVRNRHEI